MLLSLFFLATFPFLLETLPISPSNHEILSYNYDRTNNGYNFAYEAADGSTRQETGIFIQKDNGELILQIIGSFSYQDESGRRHVTEYRADDGGSWYGGDIIPSPAPNVTVVEEPEEPSLGIGSAAIGTLIGGNLG